MKSNLLVVLLGATLIALATGVVQLREDNASLRRQLEEAQEREAWAAELVSAFDKRLHACEGTTP